MRNMLQSSRLLAFAILLSFLLVPAASARVNIPGNQPVPEKPLLARVYFRDTDELNRLATRLDIWEVDHAHQYLVALLNPGQVASLRSKGYRVEIDESRSAALEIRNAPLPGQEGGIPGYPCYRSVEETYASLAGLAAAHPDLAAWIDIGDSWEKVSPGGAEGFDLYSLVLTNQSIPGPKPAFVLMAAIHAREYATAELAARFAEQLVEKYGKDPDITWLLDHFAVHILPQANPDGRKLAEAGDFWRKNTNPQGCGNPYSWGTDLNRNSSFHWGGNGASPFGCDETYRGQSSSSEPETQAIQTYLASVFPDQRGPNDADPAPIDASGVFITLHSYAPEVLFPWGWQPGPAPNNTQLETLGRKFGFFNQYPVCQSGEPGCIYATSGTTDDWAYGELGVAAYTFEVGTDFFQSCRDFENEVLPDNLPALMYAAKAARRPYQAPAGPDTLQVAISSLEVQAGMPVVLSARADDTRFDSNGWGQEPVQPIAAARYSLDSPSWKQGVQTFPLEPEDGEFNSPKEDLTAVVDTSVLAPGRHLVYVESQDADGNWGVPGAVFLTITFEPSAYLPLIFNTSTGD
jgi:carboxypeptidase T